MATGHDAHGWMLFVIRVSTEHASIVHEPVVLPSGNDVLAEESATRDAEDLVEHDAMEVCVR